MVDESTARSTVFRKIILAPNLFSSATIQCGIARRFAPWPEHNVCSVSGVTKERHGIGSSNKEHMHAKTEAGRPCLYAADAYCIIN